MAFPQAGCGGVGDGRAFLRFALDLGVAARRWSRRSLLSFGEAVGVGVGVAFLAERFRCLRAVSALALL